MHKYTFYSCPEDTMRPLGIDPIPVPVRSDKREEIFGGEKARLDLIVQELGLFLSEYPDLNDLYAGTMAALALLAGVEAGSEGDAETAIRLMEKGLEANPASLLLRSNYAIILHLLDRGEDALEQYEVVLADPEGRQNPMVRLLAARLYAEQEEYLKAYELLDGMAKGGPADDDDAFWNFVAEMRVQAGVEEEGPGETSDEPRRAFCTSCGNELVEGMKFCKGCGKPVAEVWESQLSCPDCGETLPPGTRFCRSCGKQMAAGASGSRACTSCGKELVEGMKFCRGCGKPV